MPWKGKIFVEMPAQMYKALEGLNPGIKIHGNLNALEGQNICRNGRSNV